MTVGEFAAAVFEILRGDGLDAILVGGAVVAIYTDDFYQSGDADFVSTAETSEITKSLSAAGFSRLTPSNKAFRHPDSELTVEFPARFVFIGGEAQTQSSTTEIGGVKLRLLSPTQSVMDRLMGYVAWKDASGLDQAEMICERHPVSSERVLRWLEREGATRGQIENIRLRLGWGD
jgi:hypothetical protein